MAKNTTSGHKAVWVPGEGYKYEHREAIETKIGRPLRKGEIVHHKDGNKKNNAPGNLKVLTRGQHNTEDPRLHHGGRKPGT